MIRFSNGDMFESGAEALVNVPRDANPKIEVNHLYTIKKWHAKQESIQEILYWSHGASRYQDALYASTAERIKRHSLVKLLTINGNVDYRLFSTKLETTNPLRHVRKRVRVKKR